MNTTQKIQIVAAIILLLCLLPMPYGYFTIVRVITTIISAYFAYKYFNQNSTLLAITFVVIVVLFQPFFRFAIGRAMWVIVDILTAILFLVLALKRK